MSSDTELPLPTEPVVANLEEMRIDLRNPEELHVYLLISFDRKPPEPYEACWHYKGFPPDITLPVILTTMMGDHMDWEIKNPPGEEESRLILLS